jgi:hypothetical protein
MHLVMPLIDIQECIIDFLNAGSERPNVNIGHPKLFMVGQAKGRSLAAADCE